MQNLGQAVSKWLSIVVSIVVHTGVLSLCGEVVCKHTEYVIQMSYQWNTNNVYNIFISFQQFIRTFGPIQTSKAGTKHFINHTHRNAYTHAHTRTHTHRHMAVNTIPAITVVGINITRCICITNCHYDVHTLCIIHSASSRVNSAIFEYCSRILSYEYGYWPYNHLQNLRLHWSWNALQYTS